MKKILTNNIITPVKQPFTRTSLEHLQESYFEIINEITQIPAIGRSDGEQGSILRGLSFTHVGDDWTIAPGSIFLSSGEILICDGVPFQTIDPPFVPCCYMETTYATTDPLQLSDGSEVNVHQINKLVIDEGTSGIGGNGNSLYTYLCDFSDLIPIPTLTQVYPEALGMAHTGNTSTNNILVTSSYTGFTGLTNINTLNQFNEVVVDSLFESTSQIARSRGWHQFATINSTYTPAQPYFTTASYQLVYDHINNITYDFYSVGIKIETNKIYYWDQADDAINSYFTKIDLKLRFTI